MIFSQKDLKSSRSSMTLYNLRIEITYLYIVFFHFQMPISQYFFMLNVENFGYLFINPFYCALKCSPVYGM